MPSWPMFPPRDSTSLSALPLYLLFLARNLVEWGLVRPQEQNDGSKRQRERQARSGSQSVRESLFVAQGDLNGALEQKDKGRKW